MNTKTKIMQTSVKKITVGILSSFIPTLLTFTPLTASAQNDRLDNISDYAKGILIFGTPEGEDSIVRDVELYSKFNNLENQQKVVRLNDDYSTTTYLPDQVRYYYIGKKRYQSIAVRNADGSVSNIFVRRDKRPFYQDGSVPSVFEVYNSPDNYSLYVRIKPKEPIVPFDENGNNVITQYYINENKNAGGNENIEKWLSSKPANKRDRRFIEKVIASQNDNKLPVLRFGAGVGVNINSIQLTDYMGEESDYGSQTQAAATLFADYRSSCGFGLHVDLTFNKASCDKYDPKDKDGKTFHVIYNRTTLNLPVMLRYTFTSLRGKWLPFVQAGIQGDFSLKDECFDYRIYKQDDDDEPGYYYGKYEASKSNFSFVGGAGIEYRLTPKHSVFFDVKYTTPFGPKHEMNKYCMKYNSIIFNLSANL